MSYGTKYQSSFESTAEVEYTVYILEKDYAGSIIPITLSAVPVKHSWGTDEAQPAIKGSSVTVSLLNTGSLPITDFYSNNDDQFKLWFYQGANKLFEGYLVQDDCTELMVDYVHEIVLSFTDNLGLLKDVALDREVPDFGGFVCTAYFDFVSVVPDNFIYLYNTDFIPQVGVNFTITGHIETAANDVWNPIAVTNLGSGNWKVQIVDGAFGDMQPWSCFISGSGTINLNTRNTLLNIIRVCLSYTGLELNTHVYTNVFEASNDESRSFLEQTYLETKSFKNGDSWDNCWNILETIFSRFGLTLFQANGVWNIMRWHEFRYYTSPFPVPYFIYNSAFEYTGTGTMNNLLVTGFEESIYPENGLTRSILRPWQYTKETLNYKQAETILNADLKELGTFDSTSTIGDLRYDVYEFPESSKWRHFWEGDAKIDVSKIVVVTDTILDRETDRYVLQPKTSTNANTKYDRGGIEFNDIQVSAGDTFDFSISKKTTAPSSGGLVWYLFGAYITGTGTDYYVLSINAPNGYDIYQWDYVNAVPFDADIWSIYEFVEPENAEEYTETTLLAFNPNIITAPFPIDGVLKFRMMGTNTGAANEGLDCIWKDFSLTVTQNINESQKVIGHTHKATQYSSPDITIKNTNEVELKIDDTPRASISGTLFTNPINGVTWVKSESWYRIQASPETLRIGEIITSEAEVIRLIPRTKLEGTFYGLTGVSMLAILTNNALADLNFIFGSLEIDYRNNSFSCTQYEMYITDEIAIPRPGVEYTFNYLYGE